MFQAERFNSESDVSTDFIWQSLKGFAVLKELEIILSCISFFIFTFWLQKFLEAYFIAY